jgi:hypothetical protein
MLTRPMNNMDDQDMVGLEDVEDQIIAIGPAAYAALFKAGRQGKAPRASARAFATSRSSRTIDCALVLPSRAIKRAIARRPASAFRVAEEARAEIDCKARRPAEEAQAQGGVFLKTGHRFLARLPDPYSTTGSHTALACPGACSTVTVAFW